MHRAVGCHPMDGERTTKQRVEPLAAGHHDKLSRMGCDGDARGLDLKEENPVSKTRNGVNPGNFLEFWHGKRYKRGM